MRADEAALQGHAVFRGDVLGGQRPEPGGDAVVRLGIAGQRLDDIPARDDGLARLVVSRTRASWRATASTCCSVSASTPTAISFINPMVRRGPSLVTSCAAITVWDYRFIPDPAAGPRPAGSGGPAAG